MRRETRNLQREREEPRERERNQRGKKHRREVEGREGRSKGMRREVETAETRKRERKRPLVFVNREALVRNDLRGIFHNELRNWLKINDSYETIKLIL